MRVARSNLTTATQDDLVPLDDHHIEMLRLARFCRALTYLEFVFQGLRQSHPVQLSTLINVIEYIMINAAQEPARCLCML